MPNLGSVTNYFPTPNEGFATTLNGTISSGAATVPLAGTSGLTNGSIFVGIIEPGAATQQVFTGTVDVAGSQITGVVWTRGNNVSHLGGVAIVDYVTGTAFGMVTTGILKQHNQDGTHKSITSTNATLTNLTVTNLTVAGTNTTAGWNPLGHTPNTVTANGNRSYTCVYNSTDLTGTLTPGMRLQTTRTVAAPTQCTSLNGTTQYYSKTTPAGMTFVNNFVVSGWVKLSSYAASSMMVASRYNGTSGWAMYINSSGQVGLDGYNGGAANVSTVKSYQSIPLNKWVHISAQLDMATFTATTTTSFVMIDGVDVPASVTRGGTNPVALIQAGNLEIGSWNGGLLPFPGKIAQVAIYSAKVTQATILASISQGLAGTETSLISAYSFNGVITDLNANANNLTANGSAVATNTDSPFGGQGDGTISSTLDYGIITKTAFSTNTTLTVQVPEGCTIPTSGGVSAVSYSTVKVPYGMPVASNKWGIQSLIATQTTSTTNTTWVNIANQQLSVPIGDWNLGYTTNPQATATTTVTVRQTLSTANNTESDIEFTTEAYLNVTGARLGANFNRYRGRSLAAQTTYFLNTRTDNGSAPTIYNYDAAPSIVEATLATL